MKAEKIRGVDSGDIQRQIQDAQEQLFRLRFQMGMGQMEGLKKYRVLRKDRARLMTVLNEKHASGEVTPAIPARAAKPQSAGKKLTVNKPAGKKSVGKKAKS